MVGRAGAAILFAGLLSACWPGFQPNGSYVRYTFNCCTAVDSQGPWRPGDTVDLGWIVGTTVLPTDDPPRSRVLTAELQGPYASVEALKGGAAATTTLAAPPLTTDDHNPAAPTSHITLPASFAPGFYNMVFAIDYGQGNSFSGASVLQLGVAGAGSDALAPLRQRPLSLPVLGAAAACPVSPSTSLGNAAPDYGLGAGPAYLSGQFGWYSGGQTAIVMVDPAYTGPLLIRAAGLGSAKASPITLTDIPMAGGSISKEALHGVTVITAIHTSDGQVELQDGTGPTSWRAWFAWLQTGDAGCFALQVDGTTFSEVIVFNVQSGPHPPG